MSMICGTGLPTTSCSPNQLLTVDALSQPTLAGHPPQWPHTWNMAVNTMRMAPGEQRAVWPGAENQLATASAPQVRQLTGHAKDCGVYAPLSAVVTLLRVPRPGNLLSTLDTRWVEAVTLDRDMRPIARLPSLGKLLAAVLDALPAPCTPLTVTDILHQAGLP